MAQVRLLLLLPSIVNYSVFLYLMNLEETLIKVNLLTSVDLADIGLESVEVIIEIVEVVSILAFLYAVKSFKGFDVLLFHPFSVHFNKWRYLTPRYPLLEPNIRLLGVDVRS